MKFDLTQIGCHLRTDCKIIFVVVCYHNILKGRPSVKMRTKVLAPAYCNKRSKDDS